MDPSLKTDFVSSVLGIFLAEHKRQGRLPSQNTVVKTTNCNDTVSRQLFVCLSGQFVHPSPAVCPENCRVRLVPGRQKVHLEALLASSSLQDQLPVKAT